MSNVPPPEARFEIAQLAHMELLTPKPEESLWFFRELLGMEVTHQEGQSVYLRAFEDPYHHSLKLTEAPKAGLGHVGWRASSPEALERRAARLEASGQGRGWIDGDVGHGRAYTFQTPDDHLMEVFWDVDYYKATPETATKLRNRPSRRPLRGVPVRRLDHGNILASDVQATAEHLVENLGFRVTEKLVSRENNGEWIGAWVTVTNLTHDIAIFKDPTGTRGRLHHVCYFYGSPQHLYDIGDIFKDHDIFVEAGPGKHGISQGMYMYVYEPGGNRVELWGDSGLLIFDPSWETVDWVFEDIAGYGDTWVGQPIAEYFYTYGTPNVQLPGGPVPPPFA
ncbi:catechol 2,3-dioxygenase [Streptomyces sp. NBC_00258]|uniref:catechol 2,3-dioxygenase n=1 Tax=Streptomyces sp. NBC_00258 TaxID=2903642 RepID=UPI002E2AFCA7|nr:catechol 2,3-dioxygenase [Streptomyces sp. NBC_00258]